MHQFKHESERNIDRIRFNDLGRPLLLEKRGRALYERIDDLLSMLDVTFQPFRSPKLLFTKGNVISEASRRQTLFAGIKSTDEAVSKLVANGLINYRLTSSSLLAVVATVRASFINSDLREGQKYKISAGITNIPIETPKVSIPENYLDLERTAVQTAFNLTGVDQPSPLVSLDLGVLHYDRFIGHVDGEATDRLARLRGAYIFLGHLGSLSSVIRGQ